MLIRWAAFAWRKGSDIALLSMSGLVAVFLQLVVVSAQGFVKTRVQAPAVPTPNDPKRRARVQLPQIVKKRGTLFVPQSKHSEALWATTVS